MYESKKRKELHLKLNPLPKERTRQEWWVPDLLPKARLTLLSAMGGTGKTSLAISLCAFLCREKQLRVAYWSWEEKDQDLRNKMSDSEAVSSTGFFYRLNEEDDQEIQLTDLDDAIAVNNFLYENGVDVLVIDPISALLSGDTNDNQKVRAILNPLLRMTEDIGLTILGIHHFRKPGKGGGGDARGNIMGASAWVDSSRHVLSLVKNQSGQRFLEVVKSNVGPTGMSWEVFTEIDAFGHLRVTGMDRVEDGAAQRALEEPEEEKLAPVIVNLKNEFNIGQAFNLDDVDRLGNVKSFYNWQKKHPERWQECANKKDGKKSWIFI